MACTFTQDFFVSVDFSTLCLCHCNSVIQIRVIAQNLIPVYYLCLTWAFWPWLVKCINWLTLNGVNKRVFVVIVNPIELRGLLSQSTYLEGFLCIGARRNQSSQLCLF